MSEINRNSQSVDPNAHLLDALPDDLEQKDNELDESYIRRLRREIKRLRRAQQHGPADADTKMLDWAEKHRCTIYRSETGTHWVTVDETAKTRKGAVASTLRESICAARQSATDRSST